MTTHVVMFRFTDPTDAAEARSKLLAMAGRIPGMTGIRVGLDHNQGPAAFHLVLVSEHESRAALSQYLSHPIHVGVAEWLRPRLADRAVVDSDDI
jgi:hypothetical protein